MASAEPLLKAEAGEKEEKQGTGFRGSHKSSELWKHARVKTMGAVKVKQKLLSLQSLARDTAVMRAKTEAEKVRYVLWIMFAIVTLGAATAMTKSAMFHMNAVGRWDEGHAYKFSYALSLTFVVFLIKLLLVFIRPCLGKDGGHGHGSPMTATSSATSLTGGSEDDSDSDDDQLSFKDWIMPWVLLFAFTFFEMLSGTVASLGLLYGAPTSMFVVFKSSKTIFLAIMSVIILRRKLHGAQWTALLLISVSLALATVAEGKGGKKGEAHMNLMGPALLLLSELFHATMLVLQEIAVQNYWSDPLALLSASAIFGVILTAIAMWKASAIWVELPDGGHRPASDMKDAVLMCWNNGALGAVMLFHLFAHVTSDISHIVILKHITALARTLCDAVKLILMWGLGKLFWGVGIFPFLAEAWHPGLVGSWLMLPAIGIIIYAMLMFKNATYFPIKLKKNRIEEDVLPERSDKPVLNANLDDAFYTAMFRKKVTDSKTARKNPISLLRVARAAKIIARTSKK